MYHSGRSDFGVWFVPTLLPIRVMLGNTNVAMIGNTDVAMIGNTGDNA